MVRQLPYLILTPPVSTYHSTNYISNNNTNFTLRLFLWLYIFCFCFVDDEPKKVGYFFVMISFDMMFMFFIMTLEVPTFVQLLCFLSLLISPSQKLYPDTNQLKEVLLFLRNITLQLDRNFMISIIIYCNYIVLFYCCSLRSTIHTGM